MKRIISNNFSVRLFCISLLIAVTVTLFGCGSASVGWDREITNTPGKTEGGGLSSDIPESSEKLDDNKDVYERKVIRNASVQAETKNYTEAIDSLTEVVKTYDGYIQSSRISGNGLNEDRNDSLRVASLTVCVPAEKLDEFLNHVGDSVNITYSQVSEKDITSEYYDLQSRIDTLTAEKNRLSVMLEEADGVNEMLEIEKRLYDIIEEYEAKQTQLNVYATNIAYSKVDITLSEVRSLSHADQSFGERFVNAAAMSWHNFGQGFLDFLVWFVSFVPILLVILVVIGAVLTIVFSNNHRMKKKQAAQRESQTRQNNTQKNDENDRQNNQGNRPNTENT